MDRYDAIPDAEAYKTPKVNSQPYSETGRIGNQPTSLGFEIYLKKVLYSFYEIVRKPFLNKSGKTIDDSVQEEVFRL